MKRILSYSLLATIYLLLSAGKALAFCPVCTVAVAAGVGLSRWLGVDDTISGLWVGALTILFIYWTDHWLIEKKINVWGQKVWLAIFYYAAVLVPFWKTDIISNHPSNLFLGFDKILFGIVAGSLLFLLGYFGNKMLYDAHEGKSYFPFQKVAVPVSPLIVLTIVFYFITK